jgi:type I restriction enzyme S subunit
MTEVPVTMTFAELIDQGVLEIGDGYRAKAQELGGTGPIFLRAGRLTERGLDFDGAERFYEGAIAKIASKLAQPGDTIVTTKGNSIGRSGYAPSDIPSFVYSPHLSYWRSLDRDKLAPGFLRYWSRSPQFLMQLRAMAHSTDMAPYLSLADQRRLRISVPSRNEQDAIVELLGALDDKITLNERIAATCHELAQCLLSQDRNNLAMTRLGDVAQITMGSSPPGDTYNEVGSGFPFYQGIRDFGFRHPGLRVWCSTPVRVAKPDDILLSVRAPVGRVNIALEACCIGRGVAALTSTSGTNSLLFHTLAATKDAWLPYEAEGTVFGAINKNQLSSLLIRWPTDRGIEIALNEWLVTLDRRVTATVRENQTLAELRDTLLPKLMAGELRIKDAQKMVEETV